MTRLLQSLEELKIKESDLEYLKIKEVASQFRADGYSVTEYPAGIDDGFDIVAIKDGKKLAIEVKVSSQLQRSAESIKALRKRALDQGYDEFRLVLVSPPHEVSVSVDGLDKEILNQIKVNKANDLEHLANSYEWEKVSNIEIDSVSITAECIRIHGNSVVTAGEKIPEGSPSKISVPVSIARWIIDFPFEFDVTLDRELKISRVHRIDIDKSSYDD